MEAWLIMMVSEWLLMSDDQTRVVRNSNDDSNDARRTVTVTVTVLLTITYFAPPELTLAFIYHFINAANKRIGRKVMHSSQTSHKPLLLLLLLLQYFYFYFYSTSMVLEVRIRSSSSSCCSTAYKSTYA